MPLTANGLSSGTDLGTSDWLEPTQDRIATFADATDDHQWIHATPTHAASAPFGTPITHDSLLLSLFIPLFTSLLDVANVTTKINYGLNKVRFPSPVRSGARIRLSAKVASVEEVPGNGAQLTIDGTLDIANSRKPAAVLQSVSRFYE
ncbi:MaoC family dehydratase [Streptomyces sp. BYX5S]